MPSNGATGPGVFAAWRVYRAVWKSRFASAYPGIPTALTPNGVDLDLFTQDIDARRELRAAESVPEGTAVVLFVGGDWHRKGLHVAIAALARTSPREGPPPVLWIVGSGDEAAHQAIADRLGVGARVRFFGRRADTHRFYAAADIFLLPSLYECFPLVALEAAATGLPVIGTDVHGIVDIIDAGGGWLVARTPEDIAGGISLLASDEPKRQALGLAGHAYVSDLSWARSVASVLDVYGSLAGATPQSRGGAG